MIMLEDLLDTDFFNDKTDDFVVIVKDPNDHSEVTTKDFSLAKYGHRGFRISSSFGNCKFY